MDCGTSFHLSKTAKEKNPPASPSTLLNYQLNSNSYFHFASGHHWQSCPKCYISSPLSSLSLLAIGVDGSGCKPGPVSVNLPPNSVLPLRRDLHIYQQHRTVETHRVIFPSILLKMSGVMYHLINSIFICQTSNCIKWNWSFV